MDITDKADKLKGRYNGRERRKSKMDSNKVDKHYSGRGRERRKSKMDSNKVDKLYSGRGRER